MKKLRPQVTQLMAELEFDLGLVTPEFMFLPTSLGRLPFYGASRVPGPVGGPLPIFSLILRTALHTGLDCSSPSIEGVSTALRGEAGGNNELIRNQAGFQVGNMRVPEYG